MAEKDDKRFSDDGRPLSEEIGTREQRRIIARKRAIRSIWAGFAMFGIIGWTVVVPTLIGVMAGLWLDSRFPSPRRSWTLTLLLAGLFVGCVSAWNLITKEYRNMHKED
ncbi:MAG: F0F1 ATP synthase subunit [Chlorobiaceae bacterium]|nr:F0F1 ATP synthase subunit [Chlorobiaceae bacterium]